MPETEEDRQQLRAALLDQLAHLVREAEALGPVIGRVPERLLSGRPLPGSLSIKESLGLSAMLDERVHRPRVERIAAEEEPRFDAADEDRFIAAGADWNAEDVQAILERAKQARRGLIETLERMPAEVWLRAGHFPTGEDGKGHVRRDVYEVAHAICQRDADRLRTLGQRLYESQM